MFTATWQPFHGSRIDHGAGMTRWKFCPCNDGIFWISAVSLRVYSWTMGIYAICKWGTRIKSCADCWFGKLRVKVVFFIHRVNEYVLIVMGGSCVACFAQWVIIGVIWHRRATFCKVKVSGRIALCVVNVVTKGKWTIVIEAIITLRSDNGESFIITVFKSLHRNWKVWIYRLGCMEQYFEG